MPVTTCVTLLLENPHVQVIMLCPSEVLEQVRFDTAITGLSHEP